MGQDGKNRQGSDRIDGVSAPTEEDILCEVEADRQTEKRLLFREAAILLGLVLFALFRAWLEP